MNFEKIFNFFILDVMKNCTVYSTLLTYN